MKSEKCWCLIHLMLKLIARVEGEGSDSRSLTHKMHFSFTLPNQHLKKMLVVIE